MNKQTLALTAEEWAIVALALREWSKAYAEQLPEDAAIATWVSLRIGRMKILKPPAPPKAKRRK